MSRILLMMRVGCARLKDACEQYSSENWLVATPIAAKSGLFANLCLIIGKRFATAYRTLYFRSPASMK